MGWEPGKLGNDEYLILSTLGGLRNEDGKPIALGYHTGHWEVGLQVRECAEELARLGATPFAGFVSDPCDGRTQGTTGMFDSLPYRNDAAIVAAAQKAAAHDMILRLPDGYETRVAALGGRLSGGQIQRIGLARAMYGDPVLLVLDEPNSNLDNDGSMALNLAIRSMKEAGRAVMIMAHRPAAIQECDLLMVLEDGTRRAFGPRDAVLREMVKNHTDIVRNAGPGGVS